MKKFFVSMGLAVAGTAGLHAAYAPDLDPLSASKVWSVSATLRGFYDDNYDTANSGLNPRGSYGFELSPQILLAVPLQQTEIGLRNTYSMTYYQERAELDQDPIDQSDQLDLWVDHAFSEQWRGKVSDTFVVAQEPELLNQNQSAQTVVFRVNGDNIANNGTINLSTDWTRLFSTSLTYQNGYYDFSNSGATVADVEPGGNGASLEGTLGRIDQTVSLDLQWHVAVETMLFIGGAFEWVDYDAGEPIAFSPQLGALTGNPIYYSDSRNSRSYFGYVGAQHSFLPNLSASGKIGVQYTDNYNDPLGSPSTTPYVNASAVYTYLPGSYAQIGVNVQQNATDVVAPNPSDGKITQNQESTVIYATVNHQITPKLTGSAIGSWQYSIYNQGQYSDDADKMYTLGLNFAYAFTPHLSADAGYNLDYLASNVNQRGYHRNRVYIGITAAY